MQERARTIDHFVPCCFANRHMGLEQGHDPSPFSPTHTFEYTPLSGPRIELGAEHGCVFVDKYVEGDVAIRAQRVSE